MKARAMSIGCLSISILAIASAQDVPSKVQSGASGQRAEFGSFTVTPLLSPKAKAQLTSSNETVIVSAMFSARPNPGVRARYWADSVPDNLGTKDIEVAPGAVAKFGKIIVPHDPQHRLDESSPHLLINVGSGRRSSRDNRLDCDIYEGTLISATGKNISLKCKLIGE